MLQIAEACLERATPDALLILKMIIKIYFTSIHVRQLRLLWAAVACHWLAMW